MQTYDRRNPAAPNNGKSSARMPLAVDLDLEIRRAMAHPHAALIEVDEEGTIMAMNANAAWLLRCGIRQFVGEPVAQVIPALNRGLTVLATANRNGIALRSDGRVIHVKTTGIPYRSKSNFGWRILIERS